MHKMKRVLSIVLTVCMLVSILSTGVLAVSISTKPGDGTTTGQPFAAGTGGSQNFRIPGIVTLDNGTLIAACDARWNHAGDGAGLDTIVSVSTDNGENWTYTFANYLGDNGDTYNNLSTCFIDPGIGTDGEKAYLIADLWPAGIALNTSKYSPVAGENGFDDEGHLLLRALAEDTVEIGYNGYNTMAADVSRYTYYLDLENLTLHKADGSAIEGYTVDAFFNIKGNGVDTNLFFSDSPYQPYPTDYLYMTTSTDGLEWSEPELLNLKEENEQTLLVGPGNGTYDKVNDRMIFTAYEHSSGYERACLIWMDSEGNWTRSEDATTSSWSSEATSVVLDDGTVRMFYRDGYTSLRYTDFVFDESVNNYVVADREVTTAATVDAGCQLTSILYSEQIDGKDVILVAGPTTSRRINGYIYAFLVSEDNSMELAYAYNVTPDFYAYSCLTELENGDIGLLYESAGSAITFVTYDFEEIANRDNDPRLTFKEVELLTGNSVSFADNTGYYGDDDISELDTTVAEVTMTGEETITDAAQLGTNASYNGDVINLADCLYTFSVDENDRWSASAAEGTVYLYPGNTTGSGYPNRDSAYANLSIFAGYEDGTFCIMSNDCDNANQSTSYLYFDRSGLRWDRVSSPGDNALWQTNVSMMLYKPVEGDGSAEIPGYERITTMEELTDGEYLVVGPGSDGNLYALYPSTSTANRYCQLAKLLGRTTVGHTDITFTGVGPGYTEVQIGSTVYKLTVADVTEVQVEIPVGTTVTVTEPNGNYADADTSALDQSVATVTLVGTNGTTDTGLSAEPVSELTDGTYVIVNTRARKLVNNTSASEEAQAGSMSGLRLNGTINSFDTDTAIWTFTAVDGGYTVRDVNGKYMSIGRNSAGVLDEAHTIHVERNGTTWVLEENNAYLNDAAGMGTTASGWEDSTARGDSGSQFDLYAYSEQSYGPSTELTFTGVYPGSTELTLGRTRFIVNVTGEVHDFDLLVDESASALVAGDQTGADLSKLDTSVATIGMSAGYIVRPGTGEGYEDSYLTLEDCLYTFNATDDGYYEVSGVAADGTVVYLNHYSTSISQVPNCNVPGKIEVRTSSYENMFKLVAKSLDGAGSDRGLHFHTEKEFPHWNRCGNDTSAKCHEYLVRFDAETGAPALVTSLNEIVDGGQYLIGHMDEQGKMYVLVPSTNTDSWFAHVGLVDTATEVTFTGVGEGETSLTLPGHVFEITVTEDVTVCEHVWSEWTVTTEPTCIEEGIKTRTCQLCGEVEQAEVPALGHDYINGECSRCDAVMESSFEDVPTGSFYFDPVEWAAKKGITTGATDTTFNPNGSCLRAQFVTMLWRAAGEPEPTSMENPFTDVEETDFFYKAVLWAVEKGITKGISATEFAPYGVTSRAQVVTFLYRYMGEPETTAENIFSDVDVTDFYGPAVLWAVENGVTEGMGDGTFGINLDCNRAYAVTFLYRALTE